MDKYSKKDVAKLDRYKAILITMLDKYWDIKTHEAKIQELYRHQEARIWRMIHKEFPNIVILDGHYND